MGDAFTEEDVLLPINTKGPSALLCVSVASSDGEPRAGLVESRRIARTGLAIRRVGKMRASAIARFAIRPTLTSSRLCDSPDGRRFHNEIRMSNNLNQHQGPFCLALRQRRQV